MQKNIIISHIFGLQTFDEVLIENKVENYVILNYRSQNYTSDSMVGH